MTSAAHALPEGASIHRLSRYRREKRLERLEAPKPRTMRLGDLSRVSGVPLTTITNWQNRGIWVRPAEEGAHRRFGFWDALHLAVIKEMASLGMVISGRGARLSESLMECAQAHVAWEGDLNSTPERIALYALDDDQEWQMDWTSAPSALPRSYVVLNLRAVVDDVNRRFYAPA